MEKNRVRTFFGVRYTVQPFSKRQCLNSLTKKLESFCDSISIAHKTIAFRNTSFPTSETFLTDLL